MDAPFKVGDRVQFREKTPNPRWRGAVGTVINVFYAEGATVIRVEADRDQDTPRAVTDVKRDLTVLELLGPSPETIAAVAEGLDRILACPDE